MRRIHVAVLSLLALPTSYARARDASAPTGDAAAGSVAVAPGAASDTAGNAAPGVGHTVSDLLERSREIRFKIGTSKLAESSLPYLGELAMALAREPNVSLEIVSHTPATGDSQKDLLLSRRRADVVKYTLVINGVASERLTAMGHGSRNPIAPNITRTGRSRNDRVELHRFGISRNP